MLVIIEGLAPFLNRQNILVGPSVHVLVAAAFLQNITILLSLYDMLGGRNIIRKRKVTVLAVYPLPISGILPFVDILILLLK